MQEKKELVIAVIFLFAMVEMLQEEIQSVQFFFQEHCFLGPSKTREIVVSEQKSISFLI